MKSIIIALVGASGCGKTFAASYLEKRYGWNAIVSYTTRPMRDNEVNGVDHWFVKDVPSVEHFFAHTKFGVDGKMYDYWTLTEQFAPSSIPYIYIIDEKGLIALQEEYKNKEAFFKLITVKINRPNAEGIDEERKERDKNRVCLEDYWFDLVVNNNKSEKAFQHKLDKLYSTLVNEYGCSK